MASSRRRGKTQRRRGSKPGVFWQQLRLSPRAPQPRLPGTRRSPRPTGYWWAPNGQFQLVLRRTTRPVGIMSQQSALPGDGPRPTDAEPSTSGQWSAENRRFMIQAFEQVRR